MYVDDFCTMMKLLVLVLACVAATKAALDTDTTCERRWKKVGCFHDYVKPVRPLRLELLNRRDPINNNYDNKMIDWKDYTGTLRALYCKCARLTEEKGWNVFGLQFYGECWSGTSAEERYSMQGESDRCVGVDYKPCNDKAVTECIGKDRTNYIYQLVQNNSKTTTDGGFTDWENWSECSKSCGGGYKFRSRSCTNPSPSGGGRDCSSLGESEQMEKCNDKPCKTPCKKAIDLGIIMDASSSVKRKNYNKVKSFIKDLSDDFTISASETRFGIIHYASYARLDFTQRNTLYHDRSKLKAKIDSIVYSYGGTRTDKALRLAEKEFFCPACNPTGKPKVLLVITDGNTNPGSEDLAVATKHMKDNGVNILSLGIGPKISETELKIIASNPKDKNVFKINSFDDLKAALNRILASACEATR